MSTAKPTIPKPILFGAAIGCVCFVLLALFFSKDPGWLEVVLMGIPGAMIGALIGIPIWMVLKSDPSQNKVEKAEWLRIAESAKVVGIWKFRNALIIDPESAVFPSRCIFTNQPISHLIPFTIGEVKRTGIDSFSMVSTRTKIEYLPISPGWLQKQKAKGRGLQKLLFLIAICLLAMGTAFCFKPKIDEQVLINIFSFAFLTAAVAAALPRLAGFNGRQELYSASFFKDGRILIAKPHKEYIADLPEIRPGLLHGLFGIEELLEDISSK